MEIIKEIELDAIIPHKNNRLVGGFADAKIEELAESIKAHGVLEPIIVRQILGDDSVHYELVAGERRWRASKVAGRETIPSLVRELSDEDAVKIRTIENLQREDLHPLDELENYRELIDVCGYTIDQIATEIGRSPAYVKRRLTLYRLADPVREKLAANELTLSNALLVARLPEVVQEKALERVYRGDGEQLSQTDVRQQLEHQYTADLKQAAWPLKWKPDDLPACKGCQYRAKEEPSLFPELTDKEDRCMNPECYFAKQRAWVDNIRQQLKLDNKKFVEINNAWHGVVEGALNPYEYEKVDRKTEGAVDALIVSGDGAGTIISVLTGDAKDAYTQEKYNAERDPEKEAEWQRQRREWEISRKTFDIAKQVILQELAKDISAEIPRKVCEIIIFATLSDRYRGEPFIKETPIFEYGEDEEDYGTDPRKVATWIGTLTVAELQRYVKLALLEPPIIDAYLQGDYAEALAKLAGCEYESVMRESREQAEKEGVE